MLARTLALQGAFYNRCIHQGKAHSELSPNHFIAKKITSKRLLNQSAGAGVIYPPPLLGTPRHDI